MLDAWLLESLESVDHIIRQEAHPNPPCFGPQVWRSSILANQPHLFHIYPRLCHNQGWKFGFGLPPLALSFARFDFSTYDRFFDLACDSVAPTAYQPHHPRDALLLWLGHPDGWDVGDRNDGAKPDLYGQPLH